MLVDRRALCSALKELNRVATSKSTLPALEQVYLSADNGTLLLTTTDLNQRLSCQLPVEGDINTCIPCSLLAKAVKPEGRGPAGKVEINQEGDQITILVDGLTTRVPATSPLEFPAGPSPKQDEPWSLLGMWPSKPFMDSLAFVLLAASKDETREHLCTVLLQEQDIVATDGSRLHLATLPSPLAVPLLLPAPAAGTLSRLLAHGEQVVLALAGDVLRVKVGRWQLDTRLSDKRFPPHMHVIPARDSQPTHLQVKAKVLAQAVTRVSRLTRDKKLRLCINGAISLTTWDAEAGAAELAVPVIQSDHQGEDLLTGFESTYLQQALPKDAEEARLGFGGSLEPLRVDLDGGRLAVIMPLRL